jgi:hypothetical protein
MKIIKKLLNKKQKNGMKKMLKNQKQQRLNIIKIIKKNVI